MKQKLTLSLAALLLPLSAVAAAESEQTRVIGTEASIAFPGFSVRDFEADGDDAIWIEDQRGNWYYAEIIGPCLGLNFAHAIGVETRGTSRLDKFGAIVVDGQRCAFTSFVHSEKPLPRKERQRLKEAARDAAEAQAQN